MDQRFCDMCGNEITGTIFINAMSNLDLCHACKKVAGSSNIDKAVLEVCASVEGVYCKSTVATCDNKCESCPAGTRKPDPVYCEVCGGELVPNSISAYEGYHIDGCEDRYL